VRFILLPGHRYDTVGVAPLIRGLRFDALLADKAFDSNWIIDALNDRGALICISQRPQRKKSLEIDEHMYRWRHLVENFFRKLKEFKRIAMRPAQSRSVPRRWERGCDPLPAVLLSTCSLEKS